MEDILPMQEWFKKLKKVTKQFIPTGYCSHCKKQTSAIPLSPQIAGLGQNIRQFIAFADVVLQLSYDQIQDFLEGSLHFNVSNGEIVNSLEEQSIGLAPEFERLSRTLTVKITKLY